MIDDNDLSWLNNDTYVPVGFNAGHPELPPEDVTYRTHYMQKIIFEMTDHDGNVIHTSENFHWVTRPRKHCVLTSRKD